MILIVGLGNPGEKYEKTRHNMGFMVVEQFLKDFTPVEKTVWSDEKALKSDLVQLQGQLKNGEAQKILLAKPKTYMNNSGMAVSLIAEYYKITSENIWIVYDEIDLPLGSLKIRFGGASAGHHGIDSIMEHLNTDKFWRFRLGIGVRHHSSGKSLAEDGQWHSIAHQKVKNAEDFVLGGFTGHERSKVKDLVKRGSKAIQMALSEGLEVAMNRYNTK